MGSWLAEAHDAEVRVIVAHPRFLREYETRTESSWDPLGIEFETRAGSRADVRLILLRVYGYAY